MKSLLMDIIYIMKILTTVQMECGNVFMEIILKASVLQVILGAIYLLQVQHINGIIFHPEVKLSIGEVKVALVKITMVI